MAITAAQFILARPEFAPAGTLLVAQALADAALQLNAGSWGNLYDQAVSLKAAHILWSSPFGTSLRLDGDSEKSTSRFEQQLAALALARIPRIMVL